MYMNAYVYIKIYLLYMSEHSPARVCSTLASSHCCGGGGGIVLTGNSTTTVDGRNPAPVDR